MTKTLKKLLIVAALAAAITALSAICASAVGLACGAASVKCTDLNVRSEASMKGSVIITLSHNDIVVVLEKTNETWYKINFKGTEGYVSAQYLTPVAAAENFTAYGTVVGSGVNVRSTHSADSASLGTFNGGTGMSVIGINDGWYKVKYQNITGYIRSDFLKIVTEQKTGTLKPQPPASAPAHSSLGDKIVNMALKYVGYDYVYGGSTPSSGFDCSGFTYYILGKLGHGISRTASQQWRNDGKTVTKSAVEPGDLLFFSCDGSGEVSHVGIYIGDNKFVNAENSYAGVTICSLESNYWNNAWYGSKRIA